MSSASFDNPPTPYAALLRRHRNLIAIGTIFVTVVFLIIKSNSSSHHFLWDKPGRPDAVTELQGLLYYVIKDPWDELPEEIEVDAVNDPALYAGDELTKDDWIKELKGMRKAHPVVMFSKSTCPYSHQAKELLHVYEVKPAPVIIEVDEREDEDRFRAILTRLSGRKTFPNIIVGGKPLGGWDELQKLHKAGHLVDHLEEAGAHVKHIKHVTHN